jgi:hypothetical protein
MELERSFDVCPTRPTIFQAFTKRAAPEMSLEFEYRRLAAACLELSKRAAGLADKTRLLTIAEAWLDLAERVTRNRSKAKDGNGATIA